MKSKISTYYLRYFFYFIALFFVFRLAFGEDFLSMDLNSNLVNSSYLQKTEIGFLDYEYEINDEELEKIVSQKINQKFWLYKVKKGDTLWSLSKKFKVPIDDLMVLNGFKKETDLVYGMKIKIPGEKSNLVEVSQKTFVEPKGKYRAKFVSALESLGNIIIPVSGFNFGERHGNNATDIAAPCGEPVYASQSGYVVISKDGWNGGYGNYIVIYHKGFSTLYGHLSLRVTEEGEYVEKGDLIGYVGNTGKTKGATGCHLHFEVRGASNPLLR